MTEYDYTDIVRELAQKENVQDPKLDFLYASQKGDGFLGIVRAVTLTGSNKSLDLVMKVAHRNPETHEKVPLRLAYLTEIHFYEVIVPALKKLQEEYNIQPTFDNIPKYYGSISKPLNELVVLENLRMDKYDMWDRKKLMNQEHLECALKTFAKFHALSLVLKETKPKEYKRITANLTDIYEKFMQKMNMYPQLSAQIKSLLDIFDPITEKTYHEKLARFADNLQAEMESTFYYHDYDVIIQGDSWCTNAMYQYLDDNRTKPNRMKLIDFQCVKTASPVMDLVNFFYTITGKEDLDNLDHYMHLYYNTLKSETSKFNFNIENTFSFERFQKHWKSVGKFGFIVAFMARKAMQTESEGTPDVDSDDFLQGFDLAPEKALFYRAQMKDLAKHVIDRK